MTPKRLLLWVGLVILCSAAWALQRPLVVAAKEPDKTRL